MSYGFFCDFDGTINEQDMITRIMREFAPEASKPLIEQVVSREMSVQEGVGRMFELIPSARFEEVKRFAVESIHLRSGFSELVAFCKGRGWPFAVVSGGFDFFVEPALASVRGDVSVWCNRVDASGEYLRVDWPHPCDRLCGNHCGLCKPTILRRARERLLGAIVIGDGVTDIPAALEADYVFARDRLLMECEQRQLPHHSFDTFFDIIDVLQNENSEVYSIVGLSK